MSSGDWEKAQGEVCCRCRKEAFQLFDHPTGRVCKACREWLDDNYIAGAEQPWAQLFIDEGIVVTR